MKALFLVTLSLVTACAQPTGSSNASLVQSSQAGRYQSVKIDWNDSSTLGGNLLSQCDDNVFAGAVFKGKVPSGSHVTVETTEEPHLTCKVVSQSTSGNSFSYKVDTDDGCTVTLKLFDDRGGASEPVKTAAFDFSAC